MKELKVVGVDELHNTIRDFIIESNTIIGDYEDMKSLILNMVKAGYMFNMDRDRLRDAMEDITFLLCPDDDANKDRVERGLEYDDDSDSEIEDIGNTSELC
jgi:GTPase SAR1 family protein